MSAKLGLRESLPDDEALVESLLTLMTKEQADHTLTFRRLADLAGPQSDPAVALGDEYELSAAFTPWIARWRHRLADDSEDPRQRQIVMYATNPAFIPRNHLVQEVIDAAVEQGDFTAFHALIAVLSHPFDYAPEHARHAKPPRPEQVVHQTFCGT
jgi:uncharacterized protein YdiU (UPF0061 family)